MHITLDATVYEWQANGGVSRLFSEILPRICDLDRSVDMTMVTEAQELRRPLPQHARIKHVRTPPAADFLRPRRLLGRFAPRAQQIVRRRSLGSGQGSIWHSTFFTEPEQWCGKRVVTVFDLAYQRFPDLFNDEADERMRQQMERCILNADMLIAISEATRHDVQHYYGLDGSKVRAVPLASSEVFRELAADSRARVDCAPFLLFVGDRNHYKNFRLLLEAFAAWRGLKEVRLLVVGGADWSEAEAKLLDSLDLGSRVTLAGRVDDEELVRLYNTAVAFVYPSLIEGFGIPLLEALACGCPIIASRIPSTTEVAGDCCTYFDASSKDSLVAALDFAPDLRSDSARRAKGLQLVEKYSWGRTAQQTLDVYRELQAA